MGWQSLASISNEPSFRVERNSFHSSWLFFAHAAEFRLSLSFLLLSAALFTQLLTALFTVGFGLDEVGPLLRPPSHGETDGLKENGMAANAVDDGKRRRGRISEEEEQEGLVLWEVDEVEKWEMNACLCWWSMSAAAFGNCYMSCGWI